MEETELIIQKFNLIEELVFQEFSIEIKKNSNKICVRLTSPTGIVKIAYGETLEEALFSVMLYITTTIQAYLLKAEQKVNEMENYLHNQGFVFNALDDEEMERYNAKKEKEEQWSIN